MKNDIRTTLKIVGMKVKRKEEELLICHSREFEISEKMNKCSGT